MSSFTLIFWGQKENFMNEVWADEAEVADEAEYKFFNTILSMNCYFILYAVLNYPF